MHCFGCPHVTARQTGWAHLVLDIADLLLDILLRPGSPGREGSAAKAMSACLVRRHCGKKHTRCSFRTPRSFRGSPWQRMAIVYSKGLCRVCWLGVVVEVLLRLSCVSAARSCQGASSLHASLLWAVTLHTTTRHKSASPKHTWTTCMAFAAVICKLIKLSCWLPQPILHFQPSTGRMRATMRCCDDMPT
jgi:hypothetical protein